MTYVRAYSVLAYVLGAAEYPALRVGGLEAERVQKVKIIGSDTEVSKSTCRERERQTKICDCRSKIMIDTNHFYILW